MFANLIHAVRGNGYILFALGFVSALAYGLIRLASLLPHNAVS